MKTYKEFISEMMTTQSPNGQPGFSSGADDAGPVAGRSPKMFFLSRNFAKIYDNGGKPTIKKNWLDYLKK